MKNSFKWGLVAVVVIAVLGVTVYFGKSGTQKGSLGVLTPIRPVAAATCGSQWTKTFEATFTETGEPGYEAMAVRSGTVNALGQLVNNGCEMRVVLEKINGTTSAYSCARNTYRPGSPTRSVSCLAPLLSTGSGPSSNPGGAGAERGYIEEKNLLFVEDQTGTRIMMSDWLTVPEGFLPVASEHPNGDYVVKVFMKK